MNKVYRKAFFLLLIITLFSLSLAAQQNHFIYLQTENKQPFYIKLDKKILSSSASGYLIIPKLQDGSYMLIIGFPKDEWPEQNVTCNVNKKDAGYLVKNFGKKGWGLFNLQTMEVIMSDTKPADNKTADTDTKKDIFSNTLSAVVNDPSIVKRSGEQPAVKEEVKQPAAAEAAKDSMVNKSTNVVTESADNKKPEDKVVVKEEIKPAGEMAKKEEPVKIPVQITKVLSSKTAEGTEMIYTDMVNGKADTISIFIPADKKEAISGQEKKTESPVVEIPGKEEPQKEIAKKDDTKNNETSKKEEPKSEIAKKEEGKNEEVVKKEEPKKEEVKKQEVKIEEVVKKEEPQKETAKKEEVKNDAEIKKEEPKKELVKKEEIKGTDPKFIDIELPNPNAKKDTVAKQVTPVITNSGKKEQEVKVQEKPKETTAKPPIANSDCKNFATEDDFLKLRKKMAAENTDDDMISLAKKAFKLKCFTTEQVKNLCVLFLKDEGKYKFFDAAYPFVSDSYNFSSLEAQLSDDYFITRFKAMIKH